MGVIQKEKTSDIQENNGQVDHSMDPKAFYVDHVEAEVSRSQDAHCTKLEGEAILLNLGNGVYYSLNEAGTQLWDVLETPCLVKELLANLMSQQSVSLETAQGDVGEFLLSLSTEGLIHLS